MRRTLFFNLILGFLFIAITSFVCRKINLSHHKSSGGMVGFTGSPGENNCGQAGCHGGGSGVTTVSINSTPSFSLAKYVQGTTYTIDVIVENANYSFFGFDCEILKPIGLNAGTMTTPFPGVQFATTSSRKNATHTGPKSGVGTATFSFVWVAPLSGTVTFYASGNAVNGNGSTSGDRVGVTSLALEMDTTAADIGIKQESKNVIGFSIFPNPVISELKINYSLVNTGEVKMAIYDLQGKEVLQILNEKQSEGYHSVITHIPENLLKGVYMVKLYSAETPLRRLLIIQ